MAEGTDPEDPLSEPLVLLGSHCTLCIPDDNSFLQPNHPSLLGGKTAWTHSLRQTPTYTHKQVPLFGAEFHSQFSRGEILSVSKH